MNGRKNWLVNISQSMKNKTKLANYNTLVGEAFNDVLITRKDGKQPLILNILYIPGVKKNLISTGQLIENNYMVAMEDKMMKVYYLGGILILKELVSQNRTFKTKLDMMEHKGLATMASRDYWLWHYRLFHLNFRDIKNLEKKIMVSSLTEIQIPSEVCEKCVQAKKHRNNFNKDV